MYLVIIIVGVRVGNCGHWVHSGTEDPQQIDLLLRLSVWHEDDTLETHGIAYMGQANT